MGSRDIGNGMKRLARLVLGCILLLPCHLCLAATASLDGSSLFADSPCSGIQLLPDSTIQLQWGELIEDDGPAAGYSYKPNVEKLGGAVWVRKDLVVPRAKARGAVLIVGSGAELAASLNGKPIPLSGGEKAGKYGSQWRFDPAGLREGSNEFVFHATKPANLFIARAEEMAAGAPADWKPTNRSARSGDGGKTWDYDHLGPSGDIDGEYYIRLYLEHYLQSGSLTSGVIDLGNLSGAAMPPAIEKIGPVMLEVAGEAGPAGAIILRARTGGTYVINEKAWSPWREMKSGQPFEPTGRYLQFRIELSTSDPLQTPKLRGVSIEAAPTPAGDWTSKVRVVEARNQRIVRTSVPYEYEQFDHPRLKQLRSQYKLDDVVKDAKGQFDAITHLAAWAATAWEKGHIQAGYPPWDALEILKPYSDGKPVGGFCQQHNIVFVQACLSMGFVARNVSIGPGDCPAVRGGHEVAEAWSNEHGKWVYVDGDCGWYFQDEGSGEPLSLRELRERQLAAVRSQKYPPVRRLVRLATPRYTWDNLLDWPPFLELRLIPRNNYLQRQAPLPLNQGMRDWFWTGHYVWTDAQQPARRLYKNLVTRPGDFEWTLNQARYALEPTAAPAEIQVHLDTVTPNFQTFLVELDGAVAKPSSAIFPWKLHPGHNSLKVYPRNAAGRDGIASTIVVEYNP